MKKKLDIVTVSQVFLNIVDHMCFLDFSLLSWFLCNGIMWLNSFFYLLYVSFTEFSARVYLLVMKVPKYLESTVFLKIPTYEDIELELSLFQTK